MMRTGPIIGIQSRLVELGRIRLGDKGPKGEPRKLTTFRLTSASKAHLDAAAAVYGGDVRPWVGSPNGGEFELTTIVTELDILIPPTQQSYSQTYELWDAGGCARRCDGTTELLTMQACLCDPDERVCKITTRVSVMLPKVPGLGTWRLETHGWNAAATLPATLQLLGHAGGGTFVRGVLRLEQRTSKKNRQTRRFVVPVIDLVGTTITDLIAAGETEARGLALLPGGNRAGKVERPELGSGQPPLPDEAPGRRGDPEYPDAPDLEPTEQAPAQAGGWTITDTEKVSRPLTKAQLGDMMSDKRIAPQYVRDVARQMFPGKPTADLTDEERGLLADEILSEGAA